MISFIRFDLVLLDLIYYILTIWKIKFYYFLILFI